MQVPLRPSAEAELVPKIFLKHLTYFMQWSVQGSLTFYLAKSHEDLPFPRSVSCDVPDIARVIT